MAQLNLTNLFLCCSLTNKSSWILTLNLYKIMSHVCYHCATRAQPVLTKCVFLFFSTYSSTKILNLDHMIMRSMYYPCATRTQPTSTHCFSLYMRQEQDSKTHSHDNEAHVLPLQYQGTTDPNTLFLLCFYACTSTRIINFNHMIMRSMYNHCATRTQPTSTHCFSQFFSLHAPGTGF